VCVCVCVCVCVGGGGGPSLALLFLCVAEFKYLWTRLTDQNCMHEKIKSRLSCRNVLDHLVQNLLSSCMIFKNIKTTVYITIILSVVLHG
jgi:hypothetical protein